MKFELERIRPSHFDEIKGQESQVYFSNLLLEHPEYKEMICKQSIGRAGRLDGDIIAVCGITLIAPFGRLSEKYAQPSPKRSYKRN